MGDVVSGAGWVHLLCVGQTLPFIQWGNDARLVWAFREHESGGASASSHVQFDSMVLLIMQQSSLTEIWVWIQTELWWTHQWRRRYGQTARDDTRRKPWRTPNGSHAFISVAVGRRDIEVYWLALRSGRCVIAEQRAHCPVCIRSMIIPLGGKTLEQCACWSRNLPHALVEAIKILNLYDVTLNISDLPRNVDKLIKLHSRSKEADLLMLKRPWKETLFV